MGNAARTRRASSRIRRARAEGRTGGWGPLTKQQRQIRKRSQLHDGLENLEGRRRVEHA